MAELESLAVVDGQVIKAEKNKVINFIYQNQATFLSRKLL